MTAPRLQLADVASGYGGREVLGGISLDLNDGALTAIIGPNGHGKTTLLRTISGLVRTRHGSIRLEGTDITRLKPDAIAAAGIAHVPQGDLLFADMTVLENLQMGAYLPRAGRQAAQSLERVFALLPTLAERRHQAASTLSGGERRMAGIGRGLMMDAKVIMLDEPSLGLAPIVIDQIYGLIESLKAERRTLLVVEENTMRIAAVADRVHLLDNGRFVWSGSGDEVLAGPELLETYLGQ
jgi:branched-chain amino acid transport system ATP-binding protein